MKKALDRLPPHVKDALTGLVYALVISLVVMLSYLPDSDFRYLMI